MRSTGAPIALKTGNTVAEPNPLMKKFINWYNPIPTKIASLALNSLDAKTSAELATQGAKLLTGQYPADKFSTEMGKIWSENTWFKK
jgi:raffinose/stachyose/melibiose transport system substrate-binding protein